MLKGFKGETLIVIIFVSTLYLRALFIITPKFFGVLKVRDRPMPKLKKKKTENPWNDVHKMKIID